MSESMSETKKTPEYKASQIDAQYIYDAFVLISKTPEKEDLIIGFAKLDVEYKAAGKAIPDHDAQTAIREFVGRPQSTYMKDDRFQALAKAWPKGFDYFNKVVKVFIDEDIAEESLQDA